MNKYPNFQKGELQEIYSKLQENEKEIIEDYLKYKSISVTTKLKLEDIKRTLIQVRYISNKPLKDLDLKIIREFLSLLNHSNRLEYTKNDIKVTLKNFLKWKFKDWPTRFDELRDLKSKQARNEQKINSKTILNKEDVEKIMKAETKMYWKAFFITQYEGALRTKEVRFLKWDDIKFNDDGEISELNIFSTKTKKARSSFVKEATFYLKKLREEQEFKGEKGIYVFHSKKDVNKPINKYTISIWMRDISKRVLGREIWAYLLRHSRGTELYKLAKENKISKDTAKDFMGHSEDMSNVYTHLNSQDVKTMLKDQVYKLEELPEDKKNKLIELANEQNKMILILGKYILKDKRLSKENKDFKELKENLEKLQKINIDDKNL